MCGIANTLNDTCTFVGEIYSEFQFECYTCNEDFCNDGHGRSMSNEINFGYATLLIPGILNLFLN